MNKSKRYATHKFGTAEDLKNAVTVEDGKKISPGLFHACQNRLAQFNAGIFQLKGESTAGLPQ